MTDFLEMLLKQRDEEEEDPFLTPKSHNRIQAEQGQFMTFEYDPFETQQPNAASANMMVSSKTEQQHAYSGQQVAAAFRASSPSISGPLRGTNRILDDLPDLDSKPVHSEPQRPHRPGHFLWDTVKRTYLAAQLWRARTVRPADFISGSGSRTTAAQTRSPAKQERIIPDYAALVDTAFARDARRYDGPLRIL